MEKKEAEVWGEIYTDEVERHVAESKTITEEQAINNKILLDLKKHQREEINKLSQTIHNLAGIEDAEEEIAEYRAKLKQLINQPLKSYKQLMTLCSPPARSAQDAGFADLMAGNNFLPGHIQSGQISRADQKQPAPVEQPVVEASK